MTTRPYYITDDIQERIEAIMDSHPPDLTAVADVLYTEFPVDLDRRQAGFAVLWGREVYGGMQQ